MPLCYAPGGAAVHRADSVHSAPFVDNKIDSYFYVRFNQYYYLFVFLLISLHRPPLALPRDYTKFPSVFGMMPGLEWAGTGVAFPKSPSLRVLCIFTASAGRAAGQPNELRGYDREDGRARGGHYRAAWGGADDEE